METCNVFFVFCFFLFSQSKQTFSLVCIMLPQQVQKTRYHIHLRTLKESRKSSSSVVHKRDSPASQSLTQSPANLPLIAPKNSQFPPSFVLKRCAFPISAVSAASTSLTSSHHISGVSTIGRGGVKPKPTESLQPSSPALRHTELSLCVPFREFAISPKRQSGGARTSCCSITKLIMLGFFL